MNLKIFLYFTDPTLMYDYAVHGIYVQGEDGEGLQNFRQSINNIATDFQ